MDDLTNGPSSPGSRRARTTAEALRARERGSVTYMRRATTFLRESLADAHPALIERVERERRSHSRRKSTARPRRERRAAARAADLDECRDLLRRWLPTIEPGTYRRADVWADFRAAVDAARPALTERDHGALRLGERNFFALLAELGYPVTTGRARSRWITFPAQPTEEESPMTDPTLADVVLDRVVTHIADEVRTEIRERLRSGDRLGALTLQRDAHDLASTGTDGAVIDLAAARGARARPGQRRSAR